METLRQDLQYSLRRLRLSPGFAATAVLTLAIGIGATTAIFTLLYQVILRTLPVQHPEQLYKIGKDINCCVTGGMQTEWNLFGADLYRTLRDQTPNTDGIAAVQAGTTTLSARREGEGASQPLDVRVISGNYFDVLGVKPYMGRLLRPEDDRTGAAPVAVLSYAVWQSRFHADPRLVGSTLLLSGTPVTVVGVGAANFLGERNDGDPAGVWLPLSQEPLLEPERKLLNTPGSHWLDLLVRIPARSQVPVVERALQVELVRWLRTHKEPTDHTPDAVVEKQTTHLTSADTGINNLRDQYQKSLVLLSAIAGFVLLITCANLANLMLVRGMARSQELNVRAALGAPRWRMVREMLTESVVLSILGGVVALAVAYGGVKGILALAMKDVTVSPLSASPSLPVLAFAFAISLLTGVAFGIAPAWIVTDSNPADALRGANRSTTDASARPQRILIILQAALSVALLSTAGLLIGSLRNLQHQDFRFEPHGRLIAFVDLQAAGYRFEQLEGLYRRMEQQFSGVPGLHGFAYATYSPMAFNNWGGDIAFPGSDPNAHMNASYTAVSPMFFDTVGTRLLRGRVFTDRDTNAAPRVAIVNQKFVDRFMKGKQPLGEVFGPDSLLPSAFTIVGVVDDSKYGDPTEPTRPMWFTPIAQSLDLSGLHASPAVLAQAESGEHFYHFAGNLIFRYDGDPTAAANTVRRTLQAINPDIAVTRLTTYDEQVSNYFTTQQLVVRLTTIFGCIALVLAALGIYGVTAYSVGRRRHEIGIRMALGADRSGILQMILRSSLVQTGIGLLIGIPAAFVAGYLLRSQLYGLAGWNLLPVLASCAALLCAAFLASAIPARRAAAIQPMQALRSE
ncbi:ABC transporter permease [Terriglobus aquaticus]|uniref:ABC transporter permease n=1 Tax=Terriglobus aquaticus TaxID=940139 RepID=A0ABW9KKA3_9BACT|nr:ABC transporter permease [Terriglobus aquaticus]